MVALSRAKADIARLDSSYFLKADLRALRQLHRIAHSAIGEVAYVTDGIHTSIPFEAGSGIRVISAKHPKDGFFASDVFEEISPMAHAANPRTALRVGDVILSTVGTIGNAALVEPSLLPANSDRHVAIIRPNIGGPRQISPEFLTVSLLSRFGRLQSRRETTGNVQPNLFLIKIRTLVVPRFTRAMEDAIASVYTRSLDARSDAERTMAQAEATLLNALGLADWSPPEPLTYTRSAAEAAAAGRLDAQFYAPAVTALQERLAARFPLVTLGELGEVTNGKTVQYDTEGTTPIIRSGDVGKGRGSADLLHAKASEPIFTVRKGDVLISSIGFGSIGRVEAVTTEETRGTVSEVTVVRQTALEADYLTAFLQSIAGQKQLDRLITGATGQLHLYPRDVRSIFVPLLPEMQQAIFRDLASDAIAKRTRSTSLLAAAKRAVEIAIEEGEATALGFVAKSIAVAPAATLIADEPED